MAIRTGLVVAKWGNSLAVRLPAEALKRLGVGEGDVLGAEVAPDGRLILTPEGRPPAKADLRSLREFVGRQKVTEPVVVRLRRERR